MEASKHLWEMFEESCTRWGSRTALTVSDGKELHDVSYGQLHADVMAWAKYLQERGVGAGDRVVAISAKSDNHFRFFYACWRLGAIAVPVCETLGNEEMAFVLLDCAPKVVLVSDTYLKKAQETAGELPVVDWATLPCGNAEEAAKAFEPTSVPFATHQEAMDSTAVLIYTSGSTGLPKGVMLSQANLWYNLEGALEYFKVTEKDVMVSLLPYWHAYALTCEVLAATRRGASRVIAHGIADFSRNLAKFKATIMLVVPRILDMMMSSMRKQMDALPPRQKKLVDNAIYNASRIFTAGTRWNGGIMRMIYHYCFYDPFVFRKFRKGMGGKLKFFVAGGAPLDLDVQSFYSFLGVPVLQGYGLTEAAPVVASNSINDYRLGSCGRLWRWLTPEMGGDWTFKDEEGNLGKNLRGQLLLKGVCVMQGYWNHTDASAKTMENGYLNTGDVGHVDKDGFLFIHGRNNNMIVTYGGEKLHPEAIEDAVKTSPLISEAIVIGEKCKSVYVCVNVPDDERKKHDLDELYKLLKAEVQKKTADLTSYMKPKDVLILPNFSVADGTLTATLKVRRYKIKEMYREEIEAFLQRNGEEIATKKDLVVPSSRIVESLDKGDVIVGVNNTLK
ncbi:MAG: AMP-binding protein [Lentisphaeria bacterium]|nr:AMP-binding protein [Lentisphaeria bacterium]